MAHDGGWKSEGRGPGQGGGTDDKNTLAKLFVGGINHETSEDTLRDHFSQFGAIVDSVIIRDQAKKPRGFGFVTYSQPHEADTALDRRPHVVDGKTVEIKRAIPRDDNRAASHARTKKIFMGGLPSHCTDDDIRGYIDTHYAGFGSVVNVELIRERDTQVVKGFGFLELDNEDLVDRIIIDNKYPIICGKKVEFKKAEPKEARGGGGGPGGFHGGRGGGRGGGGLPRGGGGGGPGRGGFYGGAAGGGQGYSGSPGAAYGGAAYGAPPGGAGAYGGGGFGSGFGGSSYGGPSTYGSYGNGYDAQGGAGNAGYGSYSGGGYGSGYDAQAGNAYGGYGQVGYNQGAGGYGQTSGFNQASGYGSGFGGGPAGGVGADAGAARGGPARYKPY